MEIMTAHVRCFPPGLGVSIPPPKVRSIPGSGAWWEPGLGFLSGIEHVHHVLDPTAGQRGERHFTLFAKPLCLSMEIVR